MFDGLTLGNQFLDEDEATLGIVIDGEEYPDTRPRVVTTGNQQSIPRFQQITALIDKGLDAYMLTKLQKQNQQGRANNPQGNTFGDGLNNAVLWIQNNLGLVAILIGGWFLLGMNPPSRRGR